MAKLWATCSPNCTHSRARARAHAPARSHTHACSSARGTAVTRLTRHDVPPRCRDDEDTPEVHGHITSLAVLRTHRKLGLATKLMQASRTYGFALARARASRVVHRVRTRVAAPHLPLTALAVQSVPWWSATAPSTAPCTCARPTTRPSTCTRTRSSLTCTARNRSTTRTARMRTTCASR
ncbi:GNAT family N-acetyltransferase [archaeon]|nr:MAG: GNAT family N-acetyltransferase [archaeon]